VDITSSTEANMCFNNITSSGPEGSLNRRYQIAIYWPLCKFSQHR